MFTGIVAKLVPVVAVEKHSHWLKYAIEIHEQENLSLGASISVDGVCQTVVAIQGSYVWFDVIQETLEKTTLSDLQLGQLVNIERAARFGDEIGGHFVSGHVYGTATILKIEENRYTLGCPPEWMKYFFKKGFVAIDGVSLTIVDVNLEGSFTVHLIPETLSRTTLGIKRAGSRVNIELDSQTQTIVETIERMATRQEFFSKAIGQHI